MIGSLTNNCAFMPRWGMVSPMANSGTSSIFPTPQAPLGANTSTTAGGLTQTDYQIINQAALMVSQQGIAPAAAMPILTFRMSALKNRAAGRTPEQYANGSIMDKNVAQAADLAEFAISYLNINGGQIPQNQQQYIQGVQNVAATDFARKGKPPLIPMSAFGRLDPASNALFLRANKNMVDSGFMI